MIDDPRILELRSLGASIGDGVYFGPSVYIEKDFASLLRVDDGVVLSQGTTILLHDSALNNVGAAPIKFGPVRIGANAYIGANTTIMCGVDIGAGALVGACSLVLTDVEAGAVAFGTPARTRGSVEVAVGRSADRAEQGGRHFFVDAGPWRTRSEAEYPAFNAALTDAISRFLEDD